MSNISIKINLRQMKHAVHTMKSSVQGEVKCLVIPISENNLFEGEKGIYLDLQAFALKEKKEGRKDTHLVKQSLPKEVFEKMTDEQKQAMPILGNAILWAGFAEPDPNSMTIEPTDNELDDLPF